MRRHVIVAALGVALAACGRSVPDPTGVPGSGALDVVVTTPNADDGALLVRISGGAVDSVTSPGGYAVYAGAAEGASRRIIVQGNIAGGVVARVWVPDVTRGAAYVATVEQATTRDTYQQRGPAG
ncbi:MAG TPA: hypothetical protein VF488_13795, partial [Gemmatimonadaceae bacterium]